MLFRGTERYGSQEIDEIFDAMGAEINAGTDKEATSLYTRVLDRHLEHAFDVMSDMIWQPRFGELEAEREVVLEEIAMYEDDPQDRVFDLLGKAIFGPHPLGRAVIGTAEVVGAVTREQLAAFHAERYRPESIVIAAAGSVDHDALVAMAARASAAPPSSRAAQSASESARSTSAAAAAAGRARLHAACAVPAERHRAVPRVPRRRRARARRRAPLRAARARRRARRHLLLAAVPGGARAPRPRLLGVRFSNLYAHTGEIGLYVGTRPDNLREALAVVAAELERCVADPASEEELVRSRENLKGRVVLGMESTGARMSRLGASLLNEMPILSVNEMIERIDAVELDAVRALAGELFAPARPVRRRRRPRRERVPRGDRAARRGAGSAAMIRVAVAGAAGRMGQTVCAAV